MQMGRISKNQTCKLLIKEKLDTTTIDGIADIAKLLRSAQHE